MPPESEGVALDCKRGRTLRAWIDQGAKAPPEPTPEDPRKHWAYQPPLRPTRSALGGRGLGSQPDRCVSRRRLPVARPQAERAGAKDLWLRRVYLDLIGLPPTVEERTGLSRRRHSGCRRDDRRPAARRSSPRRALGAALDGRLAIQRLVRARRGDPLQPPSHLAMARLDRRDRSTPTRATTG